MRPRGSLRDGVTARAIRTRAITSGAGLINGPLCFLARASFLACSRQLDLDFTRATMLGAFGYPAVGGMILGDMPSWLADGKVR